MESSSSIEDRLGTVNWPESEGEYKVIQVTIGNTLHLVFGSAKYSFHSFLLEALLQHSNIVYASEPDKEGLPAPPIITDQYHLAGAGRANVSPDTKQIRFFGKSQGYDIPIDPRFTERLRPLTPEWTLE